MAEAKGFCRSQGRGSKSIVKKEWVFMAAEKGKKEKKFKPYKAGRFCPKCGSGVKLAEHKDRLSCGKCGYMEKQ